MRNPRGGTMLAGAGRAVTSHKCSHFSPSAFHRPYCLGSAVIMKITMQMSCAISTQRQLLHVPFQNNVVKGLLDPVSQVFAKCLRHALQKDLLARRLSV